MSSFINTMNCLLPLSTATGKCSTLRYRGRFQFTFAVAHNYENIVADFIITEIALLLGKWGRWRKAGGGGGVGATGVK